MGLDHLLADPRLKLNNDRVVHRVELEKTIAEVTRTRSTEHWLQVLEGAGIPCAPVLSLQEGMNQPQLRANDMVVEVEHPVYGNIHLMGVPYKYSQTPCAIQRPPPLLGEHTDEVLAERLRFTEAQIGGLRSRGIV
jgi:crotonobetainyl-CoA:carnitine CoA-transferase CaiB-like acyl-CoA transferase